MVVRVVGEPPELGFEPQDHLEIGTRLGLIDMESAARASGSRFAYLKGDLVRLELALVQYAFAKLSPHGFLPVVPPVLVREEPLFWTGFLPTDRAQIYEISGDDLYLAGTSEVSLAALHAEDLLAEDALPIRYAGFSTCFRREAGAAGVTRAASSGSTSSTRSRCSRSCGRRSPATSTSGCWRSRRRSWATSRSRTGW